jgi:photosystem II stability/assembly factor-like uncharacterized protein
MNGFDFDGLRDPNAPHPGARQREGVAMRAKELQAGARRKWAIASVVAVVVIAAGVVGIVAATHKNNPEVTVTNTTTTTPKTTTTSTTTHRPGGVPLTSAATTAPSSTVAHTPTGAVSASFVSAAHGWVLEKDGTVAETTDGGSSWHRVGSLGSASDGKIRFADATHGFAFSGSESNPASSMATTDGGATWAPLAAPFSGTVYDLAISRGTVYAVTFDQAATKFRIWSSPAGALNWTEDPLKIPAGAGPIPSIQLVLAGNAGWLIEVDRVVVAGAKLSPTNGHWSAWTPPCKNVNGPATLAAWGPTDLIASCNEGVWGSPPAPGTAAYTSHDAGATWQRYAAPVAGAVAADDPNNAVIFAIIKASAQSSDGGRTWHAAVASINDTSGAVDLGFTTDSQGFVIFSDGHMLMTHDSAATWSAATLP